MVAHGVYGATLRELETNTFQYYDPDGMVRYLSTRNKGEIVEVALTPCSCRSSQNDCKTVLLDLYKNKTTLLFLFFVP